MHDEMEFFLKPEIGILDEDKVQKQLLAIIVSIKAKRKELGMNQHTLAEMVGISRQTLVNFENEKIENISFTTILRMCMVLGIDIFADAPATYYDYRYEELRANLKELAKNY